MNTKSIGLTLLAACAFVSPIAAHAQSGTPTTAPPANSAPALDPDKAKLIRQLLDVTGTAKLMSGVTDQMIESMRKSMTDVPPEFWTKFRAKVKTGEIIDMLIPIYAKYYSKEDLQSVIAFYQTPAGQHMVAALPRISADSMQVGQEWGRHLAEQVIKEANADKGK